MNYIRDLIQKLLLRDRFVFDDRLLSVDLYRDTMGSDGDGN